MTDKSTSVGRLLIFSAPSGSGKSTLVNWLMSEHPELGLRFSVSATTRAPRGTERDGVDYFFLSPEVFREHIAAGDFVEWEEVYAGKFYGTLRSQVDAQLLRGENVTFDVDVKGGVRLKKLFGSSALSIFIQPPSVEVLRERLLGRATDSEEMIAQRVAKASEEMGYAELFDCVVVNDDLATAQREVLERIQAFIR